MALYNLDNYLDILRQPGKWDEEKIHAFRDFLLKRKRRIFDKYGDVWVKKHENESVWIKDPHTMRPRFERVYRKKRLEKVGK